MGVENQYLNQAFIEQCSLGSLADIPQCNRMSALPPKADMCGALAHVR